MRCGTVLNYSRDINEIFYRSAIEQVWFSEDRYTVVPGRTI